MKISRILCLGDTHCPYINKRALTKVIDEIIPGLKPQIIIQMGDLYDLYSWSRFPKKQLNPRDEILEARACAEEMWSAIRKKAPKAKLFQLLGNHDRTRVDKVVQSKAPELEPFLNATQFWQFDHVQLINDAKETLEIGNLLFTHGHRTKLKDHLKDISYSKNIIIGHLHTAEIYFERTGSEIRWAACAGSLCDPMHENLVYRPLRRYFSWTPGVLEITDNWPRFIGCL